MCGISGIVAFDGAGVDLPVLQAMNDRLAHRGPDGEGIAVFAPGRSVWRRTRIDRSDAAAGVNGRAASPRPSVALGHRRLAILDLSSDGNQPMTDPGGRAWIVFNGEIYNHRLLRDALSARGVVFRTRTDTEVLLQAYLHYGVDVLERLEGMFAFAIWDRQTRRLFAARDRLGIKPFYYAQTGRGFLFASEIKALLASPDVPVEADDEAVVAFLVQSSCDYGERTTFRHVRALPAGHRAIVRPDDGHVEISRYWTLRPAPPAADSDTVRLSSLRTLLRSTVQQHLISDVRVGSCLSGGLDSSTVVSLIHHLRREEPDSALATGERLNTFTSCSDHQACDERDYALNVAQATGADAHLVHPTPTDFWDSFSRMAWHQDMPFGGFSYFAQWAVMQAARDAGVKVLLDGQGGDEVFGGYAKFRYACLATLLRRGRLWPLLREVCTTVRQGDRYVLDLRNGYRYLPPTLRRMFNVDAALRDVIRVDWGRALSAESTPATRWWRHAMRRDPAGDGWSLCQRIQVDDLLIDTLPQLLRMEDRSSMAFSLEARVPLLGHRLVEYGLSLPDHLKFYRGWSKFAVRQAMHGLMPEQVRLRRTKLGFAAPDRAWLLEDLRAQVRECLASTLRCERYVDVAGLRRWYESRAAAQANTESYLGVFRILSLEMWMRVYGV